VWYSGGMRGKEVKVTSVAEWVDEGVEGAEGDCVVQWVDEGAGGEGD